MEGTKVAGKIVYEQAGYIEADHRGQVKMTQGAMPAGTFTENEYNCPCQ